MAKVRTTVTIDDDVLEAVTKLADKEERSVSGQIVYFVKLGLETYWKNKK